MTFEEARELFLRNLKLCYDHLVDIHMDWTFRNPDADEYKDAIFEFISIQKKIFELKSSAYFASETQRDLED